MVTLDVFFPLINDGVLQGEFGHVDFENFESLQKSMKLKIFLQFYWSVDKKQCKRSSEASKTARNIR